MPDLVATALRETHEEVGLPAESVELIGALEPTPTVVTGYAIYPFVGIVPSGFRWRPSDSEVAAVIDLPLPAVAAGYGPPQARAPRGRDPHGYVCRGRPHDLGRDRSNRLRPA